MKYIYTLILFFLINLNTHANYMASSCYSLENSSKYQGIALNNKLPIASVSKLFTSYWAVSKFDLNHRYNTEVFLTALNNGKYHLHLKGSRDPYFGKESLHFLISSLNKMNITNIETLSFDENFKFIWHINSSETMWQKDYRPISPSTSLVLSELKNHPSFLDGYDVTKRLALVKKIQLFNNPKFTYQNLEFVSKTKFNEQNATKKFIFQSAPLFKILKQMNKTSNNHAANQVFESLGGANYFNPFIQKDLSQNNELVTDSDIYFLNGSGDNFIIESKVSEYNEASCKTVLKMLNNFRNLLKNKYQKSLQEVIAVVGGDSSVNGYSINTTKYLANRIKNNSVVAKAGTISPNITLGGMASTNSGVLFYFYNQSINGTSSDRNSARRDIKNELTSLIKKHKGSKPFYYEESLFTSFDQQSVVDLKNKNLELQNNFLTEDDLVVLPESELIN